MGSEKSLWNTLQRNMKNTWEAEHVFNPEGPGFPDVYFTIKASGVMGLMELKHEHKWPKRTATTLKIKHFTPQQRGFMRRHGRIGANICLLLQVDKDYFLMDWKTALLIGDLVKDDYYNHQRIKVWKNRINYQEFLGILEKRF